MQGDSSICQGDSVTLTAVNGSPLAWADSLNPSNILFTSPSITVAPSDTTTYVLYGSNDTTTFTVNVIIPASINFGSDTTLCQNEELTLDA